MQHKAEKKHDGQSGVLEDHSPANRDQPNFFKHNSVFDLEEAEARLPAGPPFYCLLCRRKFFLERTLECHKRESKLHKENLALSAYA